MRASEHGLGSPASFSRRRQCRQLHQGRPRARSESVGNQPADWGSGGDARRGAVSSSYAGRGADRAGRGLPRDGAGDGREDRDGARPHQRASRSTQGAIEDHDDGRVRVGVADLPDEQLSHALPGYRGVVAARGQRRTRSLSASSRCGDPIRAATAAEPHSVPAHVHPVSPVRGARVSGQTHVPDVRRRPRRPRDHRLRRGYVHAGRRHQLGSRGRSIEPTPPGPDRKQRLRHLSSRQKRVRDRCSPVLSDRKRSAKPWMVPHASVDVSD